MKKSFLILLLLLPVSVLAQSLGSSLSGKILLQVEANGEAWYVSPDNNQRYFLGRPADAFNLMRQLGVGVSNADLNKIQVAEANFSGTDTDGDGLSDALEDAFGTNKENSDSDGDGFNDKTEVLTGNNPLAEGRIGLDSTFAQTHAGKIFLQVEANGEAWYVNPDDNKRYFLGRPADAFEVMRSTGLGISNTNLDSIVVSPDSAPLPEMSSPQEEQTAEEQPEQPMASMATYKFEFVATWSSSTHPNNYPSNAHFSPFVAYSHNAQDGSFIFTNGGIATEGVEIMAETGSTSQLVSEIDMIIGDNKAYKRTQAPVFNSPGSVSEELEFTSDFDHFTFVSMIAPSPDWFVSVSEDLYNNETGEWVDSLELPLASYDAGTDNGEEFTSSNDDTQPKEAISKLSSELQDLGMLVITRLE